MADLNDQQAAQTIKVTGAGLTGLESNYMDVDSSGNAKTVVNNASGSSAVNVQDGGNSLTVDSVQLPSTLGQKTSANSLSVVIASDQSAVPSSQSGTWNINNVTGTVSLPTGAATSANQSSELTLIGALTETAPASDTASSGLNGRLQRIAQRLSSLIALIPSTIGISWFSRISDGTNTLAITSNGDASVSDGLSGGGLAVLLSVPTLNVPIEVKCGASLLTNRKLVTFQAVDSDFYWGYANTVTAGTSGSGTLIKKGATAMWAVDPTASSQLRVWIVCSTSSKNGKVTESP